MLLSKIAKLIAVFAVSHLIVNAATAHESADHNGQNGGKVNVTQYNHIELVRSDSEITIYLYDMDLKPRNAENITIDALLVDGTVQSPLDLMFSPPNKFSAQNVSAPKSAAIVLRMYRDGEFWDLTRIK